MRLLIYKYLAGTNMAVSLGEIESNFKSSERSTLFRTIKKFEENNLVHGIDDGTGVIKYALCLESCKCELGNDLHLHFHCENCNKTICLTDHKIPKINLSERFLIKSVNLVVKGTCEKCRIE